LYGFTKLSAKKIIKKRGFFTFPTRGRGWRRFGRGWRSARCQLFEKAPLTLQRDSKKQYQSCKKVNQANTQSRPSGILFASANGKLCFEYLKTFSVPENHLPLQGAKTPPKLVFFEMYSIV
jgi:hypothetical protein